MGVGQKSQFTSGHVIHASHVSHASHSGQSKHARYAEIVCKPIQVTKVRQVIQRK